MTIGSCENQSYRNLLVHPPRKDNEILVSETELSLFFLLQKYSNHQNTQLKVPYINILFLFLFRTDLLGRVKEVKITLGDFTFLGLEE